MAEVVGVFEPWNCSFVGIICGFCRRIERYTGFACGCPVTETIPPLLFASIPISMEVRVMPVHEFFLCCGAVHSDSLYTQHMADAHGGRSQTVLSLSLRHAQDVAAGRPIRDVVAEATDREWLRAHGLYPEKEEA